MSEQTTDELCDSLIENYTMSVAKALNHQGILEELDIFAQALPRFDVNLSLDRLAWWQFGVPRLRAIVKELTFLPSWDLVDPRLRRMGEGEVCHKKCKLCLVR